MSNEVDSDSVTDVDCKICANGRVIGEAPFSHCRVTHRSWTGTAKAMCPMCRELFRSDRICQLHKVVNRRMGTVSCKHPSECRDKDGELMFVIAEDKSGQFWSQNYGDDGPSFGWAKDVS